MFAGRYTYWLLLASVFFYAWWDPRYLPLLLLSIVFNYLLGGVLARCAAGNDRATGGGALLALGVSVNLGLLAFFKYAGFFVETANALGAELFVLHLVLPLAISFFTGGNAAPAPAPLQLVQQTDSNQNYAGAPTRRLSRV